MADLDPDSSDSEAEYQMQEMILEQENTNDQPEERETSHDFRMDRLPPPDMPPPGVREAMDPRGNWQSSNTGPKGVLADYEEAKLHMATERMRHEMRGERLLQNMACGDKSMYVQDAIPIEEQLKMEKARKKARDSDDSDSDSDLTDDSDDEAFRKYKLDQIRMVQNSLPSFGVYQRLDTTEEFAKVINNTHELCYVVAHLYQNHVAMCARLHLCLESLAKQFPQIRFVRIKSSDAMKGYKDVGLPAIMLYRGGKMLESYVRVHEDKHIGKNVTDLTVTRWLSKEGVLKMPGNEFFERKKPTPTALTANDSEDISDSEY